MKTLLSVSERRCLKGKRDKKIKRNAAGVLLRHRVQRLVFVRAPLLRSCITSRALQLMRNILRCNRGLCSSLLFGRCRSLHNSSSWPPTSGIALLPGQLYACVWHIHSAQMELRSHMSSHSSSPSVIACDAANRNLVPFPHFLPCWLCDPRESKSEH